MSLTNKPVIGISCGDLNGIGIELKPELAQATRARIQREKNPDKIKTQVINADSTDIVHTPRLIEQKLKALNCTQAQLAILHPPYHSIIKFSERPEDLSNCPNVESFLQRFGHVVDVTTEFLETGRY